MMDGSTTVRHSDRVVFRKLTGEEGGVLLHLDAGQYHGVNGVGAEIWKLSEDAPTRATLIERLRERLEDPPEDLAADVDGFLTDLSQRGLIDVGSDT